MKKFFLIAAMAALSLGAQAQEKLYLSTYNGTNLSKYDGKLCNVTVNRYVFTGWNTIALPFAMSEQELNDIFGADCQLERLASVEDNTQGGVTLNFVNCKADGLQANTPYMLHYTGEAATKRIVKQAEVSDAQAALTFSTASGEQVTMEGVRQHTDGEGLYGVLARDNSEVRFVSVDGEGTNGFYATRCYVSVSTGNNTMLTTNHLGEGEATAINAIARSGERVDVFTVSGVKVADRIDGLQPGVYVVKGKKVMVK
jgi:hypothetical protein